jgi:cytochrome c553
MKREHRRRCGGVSLAALCVIFISGIAAAASRYTDLRDVTPIHGDAAEGAKKAAPCFACHGANGTSIAPTFPRLAGQRIDYLYHRLLIFKHASSKDPYYSTSPMTAMAQPLSDIDMRNLAAFFASQQPQPAAPAVATLDASLERGALLFKTGDPTRGIPPCQGCHGSEARGPSLDTAHYAVYPLLRAQYAPYIVSRLTSFRKDLPHDTTSDFIMSNVAHALDDDSMQAIAAWLSSLPPAKSL